MRNLIGGLLLTAALAAQLAAAQQTQSNSSANSAAEYFTNTLLLDQDGQEVQFYSDMLQGKIVVIDTIFTTCTGICPVMSQTFAKVQEHVGDRLGKDVHLISISVDPQTDTPARLKEFGARFGAKPGWHFLTGKKENVDFILYKLGQFSEDKESHKNIVLIGNEPTGLWKKAFGLAPPADLIKIVDSVVSDEGAPSGK
jgi:cytochrome oxidase Cu insertion factor (SCO1/SenC/PrrC family)